MEAVYVICKTCTKCAWAQQLTVRMVCVSVCVSVCEREEQSCHSFSLIQELLPVISVLILTQEWFVLSVLKIGMVSPSVGHLYCFL